MKGNNTKRFMSLLLAFVMIATTGVMSTGSFLFANEADTDQPDTQVVQEVAAGEEAATDEAVPEDSTEAAEPEETAEPAGDEETIEPEENASEPEEVSEEADSQDSVEDAEPEEEDGQNDAEQTLQDLIDAADDGGTVNVADASDAVDGTVTLTEALTVSGKKVTLAGGTVTGGDYNGIFISVTDGAELTLDGVTVQGIEASTSAAMIVVEGATLNVKDGTAIKGRTSSSQAGAAVRLTNATFNMTGGEISGNTADCGAAIYTEESKVNISGGSLLNNSATRFGGAICEYNGSTINISGGIFEGNTVTGAAPGYGGGVISTFTDNDGAEINISGGTFKGNSVTGTQRVMGGVAQIFASNVVLKITGGTFTNNSAQLGGVVGISGKSTVVLDGNFVMEENSASAAGGAIAYQRGNQNIYGTVIMKGGTITKNSSKEGGALAFHTDVGRGSRDTEGLQGLFIMTGGNITNNTASGRGGGLYVNSKDAYGQPYVTSFPTFVMTGGTISGNTANPEGDGNGQQVYVGSYGKFYLDANSNTKINGEIYLGGSTNYSQKTGENYGLTNEKAWHAVVTLIGGDTGHDVFQLNTAAGKDDFNGRTVVVPGTYNYSNSAADLSINKSLSDATSYDGIFEHVTKDVVKDETGLARDERDSSWTPDTKNLILYNYVVQFNINLNSEENHTGNAQYDVSKYVESDSFALSGTSGDAVKGTVDGDKNITAEYSVPEGKHVLIVHHYYCYYEGDDETDQNAYKFTTQKVAADSYYFYDEGESYKATVKGIWYSRKYSGYYYINSKSPAGYSYSNYVVPKYGFSSGDAVSGTMDSDKEITFYYTTKNTSIKNITYKYVDEETGKTIAEDFMDTYTKTGWADGCELKLAGYEYSTNSYYEENGTNLIEDGDVTVTQYYKRTDDTIATINYTYNGNQVGNPVTVVLNSGETEIGSDADCLVAGSDYSSNSKEKNPAIYVKYDLEGNVSMDGWGSGNGYYSDSIYPKDAADSPYFPYEQKSGRLVSNNPGFPVDEDEASSSPFAEYVGSEDYDLEEYEVLTNPTVDTERVTFLGWATTKTGVDEDGNSTIIDPDTYKMPKSDLTLYAIWGYDIAFDANLPEALQAKDTEGISTSAETADEVKVMAVDEDVDYSEGTSATDAANEKSFAAKLKEKTDKLAEELNIVFKGWFFDEEGTEEFNEKNASKAVANEDGYDNSTVENWYSKLKNGILKLFGKWGTTVTVKYVDADTYSVKDGDIESGEIATKVKSDVLDLKDAYDITKLLVNDETIDATDKEIDGYVFEEILSDFDEKSGTLDENKLVVLSYKKAYTIKFDKNDKDATGTMSDVKMKSGESKNLPENKFEKEGYVFDGWNTKADGSGTSYADEAEVKDLASKAGETVTLYAQWKPEEHKATVKYQDENGNTLDDDKTVNYKTGDKGITVEIPSKDGYTPSKVIVDGKEITLTDGEITHYIQFTDNMSAVDHDITIVYAKKETTPSTPATTDDDDDDDDDDTPNTPAATTDDDDNNNVTTTVAAGGGGGAAAAPAAAAAVPAGTVIAVDTDDDGDVALTEVEDVETPAALLEDEHLCNLIPFLLMAIAMVVEAFNNKNSKNHKKRMEDMLGY